MTGKGVTSGSSVILLCCCIFMTTLKLLELSVRPEALIEKPFEGTEPRSLAILLVFAFLFANRHTKLK